MGSSKTTNTTTTEPSKYEKALLKLDVQQRKNTIGPQTDVQLAGLDLVKRLITGTTPLPGFFGTMAEGINPSTIGTTATRMALNALPGMQQLGLTDSGVAGKKISEDIANNLLFPAEQFNIGSLQNMLNLALSGQAQVQQPILAGQQTLASQLAGLRSTTQTQTSGNPFLNSFQSSLGSSLAGIPGRFGQGTGMFGGGSI